ncbi:DUF2179 domain-containing protein [Alloiococcus sp. CFN-8]|uniref:DUF2179 domain-containing protein n=1 Tax=Alloiococcus sp. CFN-8 TaxID=3416081 RepID=UPI003CF859DB
MLNYLLIFFAKILEVTLMTLRTVLMTRGERVYGAIIGVFEVTIWLFLMSTVLVGIQEDPIRMVFYALGFGVGILLGTTIEEKLALGLVTINVIVPESEAGRLASLLKEENIGMTVMGAEGYKEPKKIFLLHAKRKRKNAIIKLLHKSEINTVISISDTKTIYGGYGIRK